MKSTAEIRQIFLDFFTRKSHRLVASSSLVPGNDPTLLFTNAGMVQFKDVFLGAEKRDYKTAVSSQRCVRAGGKHNDLDQVGYTSRHHTFFEMLGNFSFGDYFKQEAILYAWELLTGELGLPEERLWVTVYQSDDEAFDIWKNQVGLSGDRIIRIGDKPGGRPFESDNFWAMGDTGPCGPCTEVFYDHGPDVAGGPPGSADEDGDRYIEIWNLVFMQYDRDAHGKMHPLPKPCVDTGMGLERISAVLQGVHSNYEIDLFAGLIQSAAALTGHNDLANPSLKVIADHIRACAFLIADGVLPSNEGRGYVLRRIIRRAVRHGYKLGQDQPFFHAMTTALREQMAAAYPELREKHDSITQVLLEEEQRFSRTLSAGMEILQRVIQGDQRTVIDGETAFLLYDTYGFPLDLTQDFAREHGYSVDVSGFNQAMEAQRQRGRAATRFKADISLAAEAVKELQATVFSGYDQLSQDGLTVVALLRNGEAVDSLSAGDTGIVLLAETPFYAESGGQVGDTGILQNEQGRFQVDDTQKLAGVFHGHLGRMQDGQLKLGDSLQAAVDNQRRQRVVLHHSATHLLHAALRRILGAHVEQKGSLVAPDRLRFDFSHPKPLSQEQLEAIETLVNQEIMSNAGADEQILPFDEALEAGALALFGEKYGDQVRVMRFGDFSVELCGGTHVSRVGDIGLVKIISEGGIAAGVRRIEAVAGMQAVDWVQAADRQRQQLAEVLKVSADQIEPKINQLLEQNKNLERELKRVKTELTSSAGRDLAAQAREIQGVRVISTTLDDVDVKGLRAAMDDLKSRLESVVVVLASVENGKIRFVSGVSKNLVDKLHAGKLANFVAARVGGRGGGRADMAQAGGTQVENLDLALDSVHEYVTACLSG